MRPLIDALDYMLKTCGHLEHDYPGEYDFANERAVLEQYKIEHRLQVFTMIIDGACADGHGKQLTREQKAIREALDTINSPMTADDVYTLANEALINLEKEVACDDIVRRNQAHA